MKFFSLLSLSALLAPVFCGQVSFRSCSASQEATLREGLRDVEVLAQTATVASEGGHGKTHAYFGKYDAKITDERINTRFHKLSRLMSGSPKDVVFDCRGTVSCCRAGLGGVPACGQQRADETIHICPAYWNWHQKQRVYELSPPSGPTDQAIETNYRPRGYVLLHELIHSLWGAEDKVDDVKDMWGKTITCRGYGHFCVLKYAQKSPYNARRNADSWALFAVAAYYGINKFQTNPDYIVG